MTHMRVPQRHRPIAPAHRSVRSQAGEATPSASVERAIPVALLYATRPRQWVKNLLVFAAPAAAGVAFHLGVFGRSVAAFGIFAAASASTYLVNDVLDKNVDRLHPVKSKRPVAAGELPVRVALVTAGILLTCSIVGAMLLAGRVLTIVRSSRWHASDRASC